MNLPKVNMKGMDESSANEFHSLDINRIGKIRGRDLAQSRQYLDKQ